MTPWMIRRKIDLAQVQQRIEYLGALMYTGDARGHEIAIEVTQTGTPVDLAGSTVRAYIVRPDARTVMITGTASSNIVSVVLSAECYACSGQINIVIRTENNSTTVALYAASATVRMSATDAIVDPGDTIPSLSDLLAQVDAMAAGTAAANKAAADANAGEQARQTAEGARVNTENARKTAETARATAETGRASAEGKRVSAETARASAESVRATEENKRKNAETARAGAETGRVNAESGRVTAEEGRANAETARAAAEDARKSAETGRANAETARKTAEDARKSAETKRAESEAVRVTAEDARKSAETGRANAEASRVAAEDARKNAETGRANAEASRAAAEDARKNAETGRANAETARKTAEDARKSAETGREQAEAKRVADSAKALLDAQAAVDAADGWTRAEASARTLDVGAAASASVTTAEDGHKLLTLGLPRGERGPRGRGLTAMGAWTVGVQYLCSDDVQHFVLYEDSSYVCHQSHTSGAESAPPAAAYWTLLASKGSVDNLPGMRGATADTAGEAGLVPAPAAGTQGRYLRGDGTWQTPPNTTYGVATTSADGLMAKGDKAKLDGVAANANNYAHPTNAGNKHIPAGGANGQILRWSADGTAAWGADNNTTYSDMKGATAEAAGAHGLVPAPAAGTQGRYLRGDGTWQTPPNTTYSPATSSADGLMSAADKVKLDGFRDADSYLDHPVAFSVPVSAWTGSGPYSAVISDARFAEDTKIDSTDFSADTLNCLPNAAIDYETTDGKITLTTAIKPSGTLVGTFWVRRVAQD